MSRGDRSKDAGQRTARAIKNSFIFYAVAGLVRTMSLLPHRWALAVGSAVGWLAWVFASRERRRALNNVHRSELGSSIDASRSLVRRMFRHLGRNAMECVVMRRLRKRLSSSSSLVTFSEGSQEALKEAVARGKGVLYVTAHLGNWELMAASVARIAPVTVLFKPSYDSRFTRMIEKFRLNNGVRCISVNDSGHLRKSVKRLKQGEVLGILLDQPVHSGHEFSFLGRWATTSSIVASLARITGASVVTGFIHRCQPCQHSISVESMGSDFLENGSEIATKTLSRSIESAILAVPDQWIWSLDRWRSTESSTLSRTNANCIPASNN